MPTFNDRRVANVPGSSQTAGDTRPLHVAVVDASGNQITGFGGGASYTEGDTDATISGTPALWEDAGDTLRAVSAAKPLPVNVVAGAAGGTEYTEGDTDASIAGPAMLGEGPADTLTPIKVDADGHTQVDVLSSALPTGAATSAKQDTIIGHLDGVEGLLTTIDGDTGNISTKIDTLAGAVSGTEMQVDVVAALPAGNNNIGDVDIASIAAGDNNIGNVDIVTMPGVVGTIADDAASPGAPVMIGGMAKSPDGTDPGNVSDENDTARVITDLNRRLYVNTEHPRMLHKHLDGTSAYTDESIVADPGDGFQVIITNIIASNGEAVALNFFLEEGSTKIFGPIYLPAVAGSGFCSGPIRLPVTPSTAVTLTSSAANDQSYDIDYYIQKV